MGDGEIKDQKFIKLSLDPERPHSGPNSWKLEYQPGPVKWAAIGWQFPANNWGDLPGQNLKGQGFRQVSFWARAVPSSSGALPEMQVKAGGGTARGKKNQASFSVELPFQKIKAEWTQYTIDISGKDHSKVISAFTVVVRGPATIFIDDIEYR